MSRGALDGLRVLEVGHIIGGPFCGHLFADHGAEVIKVEPPGAGDPMRGWGGDYRGIGLDWSIIGRGKKSITLDLRQARRSGRSASWPPPPTWSWRTSGPARWSAGGSARPTWRR